MTSADRDLMKNPADSHLLGRNVLITRPRQPEDSLVELLEDQGAHVLQHPVIEILPPADWSEIDAAINEIQQFGWLTFVGLGAEDRGRTARRLGPDLRYPLRSRRSGRAPWPGSGDRIDPPQAAVVPGAVADVLAGAGDLADQPIVVLEGHRDDPAQRLAHPVQGGVMRG